jgi:hypothetical protein
MYTSCSFSFRSRWTIIASPRFVPSHTFVLFLTFSSTRQFLKTATAVADGANLNAFNVIQIYQGLSDGITLDSVDQQWPFVVVKDFEAKAAHARITSFTESAYFVPLVFGPFRDRWEEFSVNSTEWIDESRSYADLTSGRLQEHRYHNEPRIGTNSSKYVSDVDSKFIMDSTLSKRQSPVTSEIFRIRNEEACLDEPPCILTRDDDRAIYGPVWQMSPPPLNPIGVNYNIFSDETMSRVVNLFLNSDTRSIITGLFDVRFLYSGSWSTEDHAGFHSFDAADRTKDPANLLELPHSLAVTSIYSRLFGTLDSRIVGLVAAVVPWDLYLSRLLPEGVDGVFVVLKSSCDATVTFVINGPSATFLGTFRIDHHHNFNSTNMSQGKLIFTKQNSTIRTWLNRSTCSGAHYSSPLFTTARSSTDHASLL